jgi:predicted AlkP superfamily pyrophosphatase or phosphodiesterase
MALEKTTVLNVVGLTPRLMERGMPRLAAWARDADARPIGPAFPAVTCTAQADYLTGRYPEVHGIVGNGWYAREDAEVRFWKQADGLVQAPRLWERARAADPAFTCANLFWWYNMYSSVDLSVTPRPMYPADGRKIPDVYTAPSTLRDDLQRELGTFPLFEFWGPRASIRSTQWIADASRRVEERHAPTLTLVYLPHLDYNLQRVGPSSAAADHDLRQIDDVCADLIAFQESRGARVVVLSEYGLCDVSRPVHVNRALRQAGLIAVRSELGLEVFDPGASAAFAVADHQVAHVYVRDRGRLPEVRALLERTPGIEAILDEDGKRAHHVAHPRAGDLVLVAEPDAWFTYYYWLDDAVAPDYARTVDIHRKPGYDPVELFIDPALRFPMLKVGWRLAQKAAGFRMLLDVIPLDASLVKGSHGRTGPPGPDGPVLLSRHRAAAGTGPLTSVGVHDVLLAHLGVTSHQP